MQQPRTRSHRTTNVLLALVVVALIAAPAINALGTSNPADKAGATGSKLKVIPPDLGTNASGGTTVLSTKIKTSAPQDLIFNVSLECDILTSVTTANGGDSFSEAPGTIKVWVTLDGNTVPINSTNTGNPQPSNPSAPGDSSDEVTFCARDASQAWSDSGDTAGNDMLTSYQETKTADAFNWVYLNAGAGTHTINVQASFDPTFDTTGGFSSGGGSPSGTNAENGYVGNRTLIIQPAHFASDATVPVSP